jgi:hypothetical protein
LSGASQNLNLDIPVVGTLVVNDNATGSNINIPEGSTIITLNISAPVAVTGTGTIETANIGATGTTIETTPETTAVTPGVTANVGGETANDSNSTVINEVPAPGEEPAAPSGGGGGGGSTAPASASYVNSASLIGSGCFDDTLLSKSGSNFNVSITPKGSDQLTGFNINTTSAVTVKSVAVLGKNISLNKTLSSGNNSLTISGLLSAYGSTYGYKDNGTAGASYAELQFLFGSEADFIFTMSDDSTINVTET